MYQPGDLVVYGRTGVCRVERIEKQRDGQEFYALTPLYQSCAILTPVEGKVFMRPVLTRQQAEELIDQIPFLRGAPREGAARDLAEKEKRKFGAVDERFMQEGEALLHGELAVALDIPVEEVPGYIGKRVKEREAAL